MSEPFLLTSLYNKQHQERKKTIEQLQKEALVEQMIKKSKKIKFITQFIDEIPELSYYEAKQLQKKLGNIYLKWNDE